MSAYVPSYEGHGPTYNIDSAALTKCRRQARQAGGVAKMLPATRRAYGEAVERAVRAKQRAFLNQGGESMPRINCASGTPHNDGAAIRQQQRSALMAYASQVRRARKPEVWRAMYEAAMRDKRAAQDQRKAA